MSGGPAEIPEVTIVANDLAAIGGQQAPLTALVTGLLETGHCVTAITRSCALPPHPRLRVVRVRAPARPFPLAYTTFFLLAALQLRRHGRGVVHTAGAIVGNHVDVSTVLHCHHAVYADGPTRFSAARTPLHRLNEAIARPLRLWGERYCYRTEQLRILVADSAGVATEVRTYFPWAPVPRTIPLGVDSERFQPDSEARERLRTELGLGDHEPVALFLGGDWERKGLMIALEAVARSKAWRLLVVGKGPVAHYHRYAEQLGVAERVLFAGTPDDVAPWYNAADVFVLPSAYETFSLPTFEAAACGVPLLVTRVHGVEELIEDGVNGWFIGRDPGEIAQRLSRLEESETERSTMGQAARAAAQSWTWRRMVDDYVTLYAELAGGSSG